MTEALDRLYEAMANESPWDRPTPFVGSGFSLAVTGGSPCAGWGGLLLDGIAVCERVISPLPPEWADQRKGNLKNADVHAYLALAEDIVPRLRRVRDGRELDTWLKRAIGGLLPTAEGYKLIEAVRELGNLIVTTNYDTLVEGTEQDWTGCTWTDGEYSNADRIPKMVIHLHGLVGKPESIILSGTDYERLRNAERAQTLNKALFLRHRFLFIGCGDGLYDPNIGPLITFLDKFKAEATAEHYLLVPGRQLRQFIENEISPLIVPVAYGNEFSDLRPFLENLARHDRVDVSQDPGFYEQRIADKPAKLLDLVRDAQAKLQRALEMLERAAPAMRDVELYSAMPDELNTWDPDHQEPVHQRAAAALTEPAARLESSLERLVPVFETAETQVWQLTAPKFARLAAWVAPVSERVSELADKSRQLLIKVTRARDNLRIHVEILDNYQAPYMALEHAQTNIERAASIASSLNAALGGPQGFQPSGRGGNPPPGPGGSQLYSVPSERGQVSDLASRRLQDTPPPQQGDAADVNLRRAAPTLSPGSAEADQIASQRVPDMPEPEHSESSEPGSRSVRLYSAVGAGNPLAADGDVIGDLAMPKQHVHGGEVFMLVVKGDSMTEDGVLEGDYVIVEHGPDWNNGDMVVAFIREDNGAVIKRIWREGESIKLVSSPSNRQNPPRVFTSDDEIIVHGRVTGILRPQVPRTRLRDRSSS